MTKRTGGIAREQPCRLLGARGAQEVTGDWPGNWGTQERVGAAMGMNTGQQGDVARIAECGLNDVLLFP
jgi:hypothetical protein